MLILRSGKPSKHDMFPYGTFCKTPHGCMPDTYQIYMQISKDEEKPEWEYIDNFDKNINFDSLLQKK